MSGVAAASVTAPPDRQTPLLAPPLPGKVGLVEMWGACRGARKGANPGTALSQLSWGEGETLLLGAQR